MVLRFPIRPSLGKSYVSYMGLMGFMTRRLLLLACHPASLWEEREGAELFLLVTLCPLVVGHTLLFEPSSMFFPFSETLLGHRKF